MFSNSWGMNRILLCVISLFLPLVLLAELVQIGSGSYTTTFPGADQAGRNQYPAGTPQLSGNAVGKPVSTNDWWSNLLINDHVSNLYAHPVSMRTESQGLVLTYIPRGVQDAVRPIIVGVAGLAASKCTVDDYSDWTVTMAWNDEAHGFKATAGLGMPFVYFEKNTTDQAQIQVNEGTARVEGEILLVENVRNGASFAIFAPNGSTWQQQANIFTSDLGGKNYFSAAILPLQTTGSKIQTARNLQQYAYVFPTNTQANYSYNEQTAVVTTEFVVETQVKEGSNDKVLLGLFPHQWANLAAGQSLNETCIFNSIKGDIKICATNRFVVENTFRGILPTLPYVDTLSLGFSAEELTQKVNAIKNDQIDDWTDSYNDGQLLNRLIQTARIAAEMNNEEALNTILNTVQQRLENWLTYTSGEVAFLFYYNEDWTAMLGYPAGHGQDNNLNDHHFHWGYFIHAAAFLEQYRPGWADQWKDMVNLLVRDAASYDRNDTMFPYLRNFSPYAGHCWANGFATFPQGNDQESTSESMQFNSALIHWGVITGNDEIRDLGIYLYTTEQTAIEEYWFDVHNRNFPANQQYALVSRVWGNDVDNGTFWTSDIAASYGIELYPIHGGSLYLGHNQEYVNRLWNEIKNNTGIMQNEANANLWHDVMWEFAAFTNPSEAIALYDSYPERTLKFGISDAQTYHWLHAMNALGKVDASVTADYPIAAVFNKGGRKSYVAHNYTGQTLVVNFSDGQTLSVPAKSMGVKSVGDILPEVTIVSPAPDVSVFPGETVEIEANVQDYSGNTITKVEFFVNGNSIGNDTEAPYVVDWTPEEVGTYSLVAQVTNSAGQVQTSESVQVMVLLEGDCEWTTTEASQGSFSEGYVLKITTEGNKVVVKSKILDREKVGVVAYLWRKEPFLETQMTEVNGWFEASISGVTMGETMELACKYAYSGGMSVTKYFEYTVGELCAVETPEDPSFNVSIESPSNGQIVAPNERILIQTNVTAESEIANVEFYVNDILIGNTAVALYEMEWTNSGVGNYTLMAKMYGTDGKVATSEPVQVKVMQQRMDECYVLSNEASQGTFSQGYELNFETEENDVIVQAKLLDDDKMGVVAYAWNKTPFAEYQMTATDDGFVVTIPEQLYGQVLELACKFAYAGGMSVTKYYEYTVGNNCEGTSSELALNNAFQLVCFPNPTANVINLQAHNKIELVQVYNMMGLCMVSSQPNMNSCQVNVCSLPAAYYVVSAYTADGKCYTVKFRKM